MAINVCLSVLYIANLNYFTNWVRNTTYSEGFSRYTIISSVKRGNFTFSFLNLMPLIDLSCLTSFLSCSWLWHLWSTHKFFFWCTNMVNYIKGFSNINPLLANPLGHSELFSLCGIRVYSTLIYFGLFLDAIYFKPSTIRWKHANGKSNELINNEENI